MEPAGPRALSWTGVEVVMPSSVLDLSTVRVADANVVGTKAANLGELLGAGLCVPPGVVAAPGCTDEALRAALGGLGDVPVAVRSSGVAEDGPHASWAGQFDTFLNVRGADAILAAVADCRDGARGMRALAYGAAQGAEPAPLAVLVQRMVAAEAAGVAFTANPLTGDRGQTLVSAVNGLGDRLVSGQADPDEWLVDDGEARALQAPEAAITAEQALAVATVARRCEAVLGCPQDVEWALCEGTVYLLQSRPITSLPDAPVAMPVVVPPGRFWEREDVHFPLPLCPAGRWLIDVVTEVFGDAAAAFGVLLETVEHVEIGGRVYCAAVPLGGGPSRRLPPAPVARWLVPVIAVMSPAWRRRLRAARAAVRQDAFGGTIADWRASGRDQARARNAALRAVDLAGASPRELVAHLDAVIAHLRDGAKRHMRINLAALRAVAEASFLLRDQLGWDTGRVVALLAGSSEASTRPGRDLAEIASMARVVPEVCAVLERPGPDVFDRLAGADAAVHAALMRWMEEHGCRALRYEIIDPSLEECPVLVAGLLHAQVVRPMNLEADNANREAREQALDAAHRALDTRAPQLRPELDRVVSRALAAYGAREENEAYLMSTPLALVRRALLAVGDRLVSAGVIAVRDDVFFLEIGEVNQALLDGVARQAVVRRRRSERSWAMHADLPASFGTDPGGAPPLDLLPRDARLLTEAMLWSMSQDMLAPKADPVAGDTLRGAPGGTGTYCGPVRVVRDESEFGRIEPGDVLVCPITSPVWSVVFPSVGAIVTDTGGVLSHSAIIAREFRIPAVLGTGSATSVLRDGQTVRVDGGRGIVEVVR